MTLVNTLVKTLARKRLAQERLSQEANWKTT